MPWFKVDDQLAFNPKVLEAGNAAMGLWVRAGSWCAANLTDGQLPAHMIGTFGAQKRNARSLVESGLWVETETGYRFKDWEEFQPTKAEILRERAETAERVRKHREAKRNGVTNTVSNGSGTPAPSRPDPTIYKNTIDQSQAIDRVRIERFEEFWKIYPRKVGKQKAQTKYATQAKKHGEQTIIDGARRLAADPNLPEPNYIPHPTTWLERGGWNDEPLPPRNSPSQESRAMRNLREVESWSTPNTYLEIEGAFE